MASPPEQPSSELEGRLQAALGPTYRVLRELGGGGMSRVFLAEEPRLGRQVVVKVLPPEMGAGVNADRFEREIRLAARLQHPHIVPLLTAGAAGDLLYYVMPFIAGESLRAKLAREGELPIPEAVRILRDVVDALAYAHRSGVVHRDIKPDNVLLAEGHALVTDFGVAKAVSASGASGSLTSLGVALGTPAYMAPEQAAADPHVDQRADLYAAGALAYEMLCGMPPFTAASSQELLAAHLTQAPEPIARRRPAVSPALNTLVMRCLEKRPADRWQSAADLIPQLEAMATPSGGTTPITARPAAAAPAAARRAHPARVAALFLAASGAVLAAVYGLVRGLGLPDWVLSAAAVLLAVGLPIVLVTGHHERRRALAGLPAQPAQPAPAGVGRWFTWRRALLGGVLAFTGLGLITAGYSAMRLLGIGPVGTLVAAGVLREREPLVLADFENRTADSTLGPSLTEAFRVDLTQSPLVRLVDPPTVADALQRMQRPAAGGLSPGLAREVAERLGSKAVVAGQIDPVGGGYVLSATLVAAADGRVLAAVRETAEGPAALLTSIDRLSAKLRERIGESLVSIRGNPPLERVTTGSLAALRKYSEAVRLFDAGRLDEAIPLLEEAVALDTGFAMAHRKLAVILGNIGGSTARAIAAASRAFAHRDRLPELERQLAVAYYYSRVDFDPAKVIAAYRAVLAVDPDNPVAVNNLGLMLNRQRRWVEAESLLARGLRVRASLTLFDNLIDAQLGQGHTADARATVERQAKEGPSRDVLMHRAIVAAADGDYAAAARYTGQLRRDGGSSPLWQAWTSQALAQTREREGKLSEAASHLRELMAAQEARGLPQEYVATAADLAMHEIRYRNRPAAALAIVSAALAKYPLDSMPALDRPLVQLAALYAAAGRVEEAKRLLRRFESEVPAGIRRGVAWRHLPEGLIARAEGRKADAVAAFRALNDESGPCTLCGLYELAAAYDALGRTDSAIAVYERLVGDPSPARLWDGYAVAPSLKRLGELYEAQGDRKRAAERYARFVELWKDADPELQPGVREVRGRVARLSQEPGP